MTFVLICSSCHTRDHGGGRGAIPSRHLLGAESPRSRCRQVRFLLGTLPGLQAQFPYCVFHLAETSPPIKRALVLWGKDPTLWPHLTSVTSLSTVTLGVQLWCTNLGGCWYTIQSIAVFRTNTAKMCTCGPRVRTKDGQGPGLNTCPWDPWSPWHLLKWHKLWNVWTTKSRVSTT